MPSRVHCIIKQFVYFSECCGGPAGILADEAGARSRSKERSPGGVRVPALKLPTLCVLCLPPRGKLFWQFSGTM